MMDTTPSEPKLFDDDVEEFKAPNQFQTRKALKSLDETGSETQAATKSQYFFDAVNDVKQTFQANQQLASKNGKEERKVDYNNEERVVSNPKKSK